MVDELRRKILKAGAAAAGMAAVPPALAAQTGAPAAAGKFFEKGGVRIHYNEWGTGFPLLLIAGGGLNSTMAGLNNPFDAVAEFRGEYRCVAADLRNATTG